MNIDDIKIGQLKELNKMMVLDNHQPDILSNLIGEKVLVRDHMAGLFITTLNDVSGKQWTGRISRRIHWWEKAGAVEGIAETGLDTSNSRIAVETKQSNGQDLVQICTVTDSVYEKIMGAPTWNPK